MKILLHIGWLKTGSTAIQQFLHANRDAILQRTGILYPGAGVHTVAHHLAAWSLQEPLAHAWAKEIGFKSTPEEVFGEIFREAQQARAKSLIVSSEVFCQTSFYRISRLAGMLAGHEVRVIAYLRRQDDYVESAYKQVVRGHVRFAKKFQHFAAKQLSHGRLDYEGRFLEWETQFPGVAITIRPYERERFPDRNVVLDFLRVAGIPADAGWDFSSTDANLSLSAQSTRALAWINANVPLAAPEHERVVEALRAVEAAEGDTSRTLFTCAGRSALMRSLDESNRRLFRRYGAEDDAFASWEQPAEPQSAEAASGSNGAENAMLKRIGRVVGELARRPQAGVSAAPVSPDTGRKR